MAKFTFSLQALLKARLAVEQRHQVAVAKIEYERRTLEERIRAQQGMISDGKQEVRSGLIGAVDAQGLRHHASASLHLMRQAQRLVLELHGVHHRMEAARQELVEAAKARRAVELLRDRRWEEWKVAEDKIEVAALDELAVIAAARGST